MNTIIHGDTYEELLKLPDESVDCIVTSPPYYGLRDYGVDGQIGLEETFDEYLDRLLAITEELHRILKPTGTMWWNHGDSYASGGKGRSRKSGGLHEWGDGSEMIYGATRTHSFRQSKGDPTSTPSGKPRGIQDKCMLMQPYRLAQRMVDEQGWILRNIIIWHKPSCMPSSVKDRFTVDFEPVLFFAKNKRYWFEQQFEELKAGHYAKYPPIGGVKKAGGANRTYSGNTPPSQPMGRTKRTVWRLSTKSFPEAHFAVFPEALVETPIKAGCPEMICNECGVARRRNFEGRSQYAFGLTARDASLGRLEAKWGSLKKHSPGLDGYEGDKAYAGDGKRFTGYTDCGCNAGWKPGIVLDPFMGAGTTAVVAEQLGRQWVGVELNTKYIEIASARIERSRASRMVADTAG